MFKIFDNKRIKKQIVYLAFVAHTPCAFCSLFHHPFHYRCIFPRWLIGTESAKTFNLLESGNYINLFTKDKNYFHAMIFTFKYVLLVVTFTNILGLVLAFFLDMKILFRNFMRASFFLPNVISPIIAGFIWTFIFTQGSLSLFKLTKWNLFDQSWLSDPKLALFFDGSCCCMAKRRICYGNLYCRVAVN